MTTEEAIRILDPGTVFATLGKIEYYGGFIGIKAKFEAYDDACRLAAAALRAQQEMENPKPLTLGELRKMDGEPVWIKADHYGVYADVVRIVRKGNGDQFVMFSINYRLQENGYGKTWLAYRHKPEEGCP